MKSHPDTAHPPDNPLWQVVLARDQALIETRKTYDKRCAELGAAVKSTKEYLAGVEKDRDASQAALKEAQAALKEAQTAHQLAMDQTVGYLRLVEADSAERLKSIEFYQGKLKTAYSDHDRNVIYMKTLETEIQKHIEAGAEREARIAALSAQLNATGKSRPDES